MKKIKIKLSAGEVGFLEEYKKEKGRSLRQINRANILLLCDKDKREKDISEFLGVTTDTIWRVKSRYFEEGLTSALEEKPRPGQPKKFTERHEADLTALACSKAPEGRERWTLELLTEKMQETLKKKGGMKKSDTMSKETIRLYLKKMGLNPG